MRDDHEGRDERVMVLRGKRVVLERRRIHVSDLAFYLQNPRIFSKMEWGGKFSQERAYEILKERTHVKELKEELLKDGAVNQELIVRERTGDQKPEVIEGNSRLAACRMILESGERDKLQQPNLPCAVLAADVGNRVVASILFGEHIKGKAAWQPYEQGAYVYRLYTKEDMTQPQIDEASGIGLVTIRHYIAAYEMMEEYGVREIEKWSYFYEYQRTNNFRQAEAIFSGLKDRTVKGIVKGDFGSAMRMRDKMKELVKAPIAMKKFISGGLSFDQALLRAEDEGGKDVVLGKVKSFEKLLKEQKDYMSDKNNRLANKFVAPLRRIYKNAKAIHDELKS